MQRRLALTLSTVLAASLVSGGLAAIAAPASAATGGALLYGLTTTNHLVSFRAGAPGTPITDVLVSGESLVGLDVRPATSELFALGSSGRVYVVDPTTAALTGTTGTVPTLNGTAFGLDFNPSVDRIRVVSDAEQNLRLNPTTGAVAGTDTALAYVAGDANVGTNPNVVAAAYTNNVAGSGSAGTDLFGIDSGTDVLVRQGNAATGVSPNTGQLSTIGALGVDTSAVAGLDIDAAGNTAYAVLTVGGVPNFYTINLTTGAATLVGAALTGLTDVTTATPRLRAAAVSVGETTASATVTITRTGDVADAVTVNYATSDGTATAGSDYTATSGTASFAAGATTATFPVPILTDLVTEGTETLTVTLSSPSMGVVVSPATSTVSITEQGLTGYALQTDNKLATYLLSTPGTFTNNVAVTGLGSGEDIVGIDVRPATGALYALTGANKLYTVDPATGAATLASTLSTALSGVSFGVDFNPVPDRMRIVSNTGQNLRVDVDTGAVTTDTVLSGSGVFGAAYLNSFAGATATTLFDVDTTTLYLQNPPNNGTLTAVGPLGVTAADGDLDIATTGPASAPVNTAFAALSVGGVPSLYRVNTTTGAVTSLGAYATTNVEDLALPLPGALAAASTTVTEAGIATVTVTRTKGSQGTLTVDYATGSGTATAGTDYTAGSGTLSFADGETSKSFTVSTAGDSFVEGAETIPVVFSNTNGGSPAVAFATITVADDETGVAYALTAGNSLYAFNPVNPSAAGQVLRPIAGLTSGERVLGIDVRPANGLLYGITSSSRILIIDPATGSTQLASTSSALVSGADFGVDFNPVADRLRVVSEAGQNLRINVDTGAATVDTPLTYAVGDTGAGTTPAVSAAGYTNSVQGATATALFDIDLARDALVAQTPPNNGTLTTVGLLGFDATSAGLDLVSPGDSAFAVLTRAGVPGLYRISTTSGAHNLLGALPDATTTDVALATPAASAAGRYHALAPARLLDTRTTSGPVAAGADRTVQVTGVGGVPSTGVSAVAVNVTVVGGTLKGNLAVYPTGQQPSTRTSNLNYAKGQTIAVQVQTGVGTGGAISVSTATGAAQVVVDVLGWYGTSTDTAGQGYQSLTPSRLLDTRTTSRVTSGADRNVQVTGLGGVPAGATAVAVNVTATGATGSLYVGLYPGGAKPSSPTSTLNVVVGQTVANSSVVTLGADGSLGVTVGTFASHVIIDVVGYYGPTGAGRFVALTPSRLLDQRTTNTPVTSTQDSTLTVAGAGGVPATGVGAAALSVTGTLAGTAGYVQAYPTGALPAAPTSTLNIVPGTDVANLAVSSLGTGGAASFKTSSTYVYLVVDVTGYFTLS